MLREHVAVNNKQSEDEGRGEKAILLIHDIRHERSVHNEYINVTRR